MVFIFQLVNTVYYIDWFANIEESLNPSDSYSVSPTYTLGIQIAND